MWDCSWVLSSEPNSPDSSHTNDYLTPSPSLCPSVASTPVHSCNQTLPSPNPGCESGLSRPKSLCLEEVLLFRGLALSLILSHRPQGVLIVSFKVCERTMFPHGCCFEFQHVDKVGLFHLCLAYRKCLYITGLIIVFMIIQTICSI